MLNKKAASDDTESGFYLERYIDEELDQLLPELRALAIDGPKGCGKTCTAVRRVDKTLSLDNPSQLQLVENDMSNQLHQAQSLCIDEWQLYPSVWDAVRRTVDQGTHRTYIFTGSATPRKGVDTHSGAGRIASLRLRPMSLSERENSSPTVFIKDLFEGTAQITGVTDFSLSDYATEICASGFPAIHRQSPRIRRQSLRNYVDRIIDRDIVSQGRAIRSFGTLRAWLSAYAAAISTTASYSSILNAATVGEDDKPARATTSVYRDLLEQVRILDPVSPWLPVMNPLKRLTSSPKHQLCDPALSATVLGITPDTLMSGAKGTGEMFGRLFESLATMTVRAAGQVCEAETYHLRTRGGDHEVDLLLERYDGALLAFEVKLATVINDADVRHLHWLGNEVGDRLRDKIIITTGQTAFRRNDGVAVVPLALLG